jgi:hypothetical protein
VNAALTSEQLTVLNELIQLAGGIGCMKEKAFMNARQSDLLPSLKMSGYVATTGHKFVVILSP